MKNDFLTCVKFWSSKGRWQRQVFMQIKPLPAPTTLMVVLIWTLPLATLTAPFPLVNFAGHRCLFPMLFHCYMHSQGFFFKCANNLKMCQQPCINTVPFWLKFMLKIVLKFVLNQYEGCLKGIPPSTYLRIIIILFRHPLSSKKILF